MPARFIMWGRKLDIKITDFRGRLPDLLFIRKEYLKILEQKAVYGPPDLVIEVLLSPNDRLSDINALETDYLGVGVGEILFVDPRRKEVRILRKSGTRYRESIVRDGTFALKSMDGVRIETRWFFDDPQADERAIADRLSGL